MSIPLNGWLNIDKPLGVTSNQVLGMLKRVIRQSLVASLQSSGKVKLPKIGHAGTLDPLASGILPIALGEATKTIPYLMNAKKTYEFTIKFGAETETCDAEGKITATTDKLPSLEDLEKIIPQFTGKIRQKPPAYSAIKINGERAYDLARKGVEFEIKEREIEVYRLVVIDKLSDKVGECESFRAEREILWSYNTNEISRSARNDAKLLTEQNLSNPLPLERARGKYQEQSITLRAICSKGTYIRSLARDIARALGSLGYVTYLRRTEYGGFDLNNAVTIGDITKNKDEQNQGLQTSFESIISQIQPIDVVLDDIPVLHLDGDLCKRLRDGQSVNHNQAGSFRVYCNGKLHSIAKCDGEKLKTVTVFN